MSEIPVTVSGVGGPEAGGAGRPSRRRRLMWQVALPTAVVAAVGVGVLGFASVSSGAPSPSPSPSATASADNDKHPWGPRAWGFPGAAPWAAGWGPDGPAGLFNLGGLSLTDALHGQVVVSKDGGGTETLLIQRGTPSQVSGSSITLKSSDGYTKTYQVNGDTVVNGEKGKTPSFASDAEVVVVAKQSGDSGTAVAVLDFSKFKGRPAKPSPSHS
jgi:hypothetical protein